MTGLSSAASSATPPPSGSSPSPDPHSGQTVSPDATKIALALAAIFIMCVFGTAYYAGRYFRQLTPNSDQRRSQENQRQQRYYYYYRRAGGSMQLVELRRGSHARGSEGTGASRVPGSKGLSEDKIARFPIVEFRHEDLVPLSGLEHGHGGEVVTKTVELPPDTEFPRPATTGKQTQAHQHGPNTEPGSGLLLSRERFPTISKAIASIRPSTATLQQNKTANDEEKAQPHDSLTTRINCSICTDDLTEGVRVRRLPCGHVFHPGCLDPWLKDTARTCPLCRLDLDTYLVRADSMAAEEAGLLQRPETVKLRNDSVP